MDGSDYSWHFDIRFGTDSGYEAIRDFTRQLDAALLAAAERSLSEGCDGEVTLEVCAGADGAVERKITLRKAYQITELPGAVDQIRFRTAGEAIERLRMLRRTEGAAGGGLTVLREPDGWFSVGRQPPDACDFSTRAEADEALQGFADRSRFAVIPYLELVTERPAES